MTGAPHDLVIRGGRVVDPESGTDRTADVGVDDGRISAIGPDLAARREVDATGCIVAPGFIDLHSHAQSLAGHRLQALDGVTTALDLEVGLSPVGAGYDAAAAHGRPLHHGFSASWSAARMHVLAGVPRDADLHTTLAAIGDPRWQREASPAEVDRILAVVADDLAAGALGIGLPVGYAQDTGVEEYLAAAALAAAAGAPTASHVRDLVEVRPDVRIDGAEEVVRAAAETGAHMHYCHVNSTSGRHTDRVLGLLDRAVAEGSRVTVEAYPYGSGMTAVGAWFLAPDQLARRDLAPTDLTLLGTGERLRDAAHLLAVRRDEPGALVAVSFVDDEAGLAAQGFLRRALAAPGTIVASDAMMPVDPTTGGTDLTSWPLPPGTRTHPRTAGTFTRSLRLLVEQVGLTWPEALARCSLLPARVVEGIAPAMRRKGRVQVGCDADLVVLDPAVLADHATYADGARASTGVRHLLVDGTAVVRDGALRPDVLPGRAVRGVPA